MLTKQQAQISPPVTHRREGDFCARKGAMSYSDSFTWHRAIGNLVQVYQSWGQLEEAEQLSASSDGPLHALILEVMLEQNAGQSTKAAGT